MTDDVRIFMQSNRSKTAHDENSGMMVGIAGKRKLIPASCLSATLSDGEQYDIERMGCSILRLTVQVEPVCTNVLTNNVTEVVKDEGSSAVTCLNYAIKGKGDTSTEPLKVSDFPGVYPPVNQKKGLFTGSTAAYEAVRDSQLSNENNGFAYHCGKDFLNNHLLRARTFKTVNNYEKPNSPQTPEKFNTIEDWMRDGDGKAVSGYADTRIFQADKPNVQEHLYQYNETWSYQDTLDRKIKEENGWIGFKNTPKILSYSSVTEDSLNISLPLNNKEACSFVDFCPERELFTFGPMYNKFRRREERNWNYCLTYPSSATTDVPFICPNNNGLMVAVYDEMNVADNGTRQTAVYSISQHGLHIGDTVNIYAGTDTNQELLIPDVIVSDVIDPYIFTYPTEVMVSSAWTGLEDGYVTGDTFTAGGKEYKINKSSNTVSPANDPTIMFPIVNGRVSLDKDKMVMTYKRTYEGIEDQYYARIFTRLPNFKFADSAVTEDNVKELEKKFREREYDFESHPSRMAFARNIYSDFMGEIVFTDDIRFDTLNDNLGRPLTEIYLTIIKNNRGYQEWYGKDQHIAIGNKNVEYSHVFGKNTCGFELSDDTMRVKNPEQFKNVRTINNDNDDGGLLTWKMKEAEPNYRPKVGGGKDEDQDRWYNEHDDYNEVNYFNDTHYWGDLASYNEAEIAEHVIQPVMFRINTEQRELSTKFEAKKYFESFTTDEIESDDYDYNTGPDNVNNTFRCVHDVHERASEFHEGYYYQPHYRIPIRTWAREISSDYPKIFPIRSLAMSDGKLEVTTIQQNYAEVGDKLFVYDREENTATMARVTDVDGLFRFRCQLYNEDNTPSDKVVSDRRRYRIVRPEYDIMPTFAKMVMDGSCRFVWRDLIPNGYDNANVIEQYPFTNGAFYVNLMVRLYMRRQDPYAEYDLYHLEDKQGNTLERVIIDDAINVEDIEC